MSTTLDHLPSIATAPLPVAYKQARTALAECWKVDECKGWADKAQAMASYAKQSKDKGLYEVALRIQARAIRRCGELLSEFEASKGGQPTHDGGGISRNKAAKEAGLSERQKNTALRVANIPKDEFDQAVESNDPPTVTALAERGTKKKVVPLYDLEGIDPVDFKVATTATAVINWLYRAIKEIDPLQVAKGLKPMEQAEVCAHASANILWLNKLIEVLTCTKPKT